MALRNYQLATHTYGASIHDSNAITAQAVNTIYGRQGRVLSNELEAAQRLATEHFVTTGSGRFAVTRLVGAGDAKDMMNLAMHLPETLNAHGKLQPLLRAAVIKMMATHGANWQDFEKIISKDKSLARGTLYDATHSSAQWQSKNAKLVGALASGGFFTNKGTMALNRSEMKSFLDNKHVSVAEAARDLPGYAHQYHLMAMADSRALATNLPPDARKFYQEQKSQAEEGLRKTDKLIQEIRTAAKDTHLSGESVDKLTRGNEAALRAVGLTPTMIAAAIAAALSPYIKTSSLSGTGALTTGTKGAPRP